MREAELTDAKREGHAALAALDRALEVRPAQDATDFTLATEHLCEMRRHLLMAHRGGFITDELLPQINAVISCSLSGHFPLGQVPWALITSARESLRNVISKLDS